MGNKVMVNPKARCAWPLLPVEAPAGSIWIGPAGERVRVYADGSAAEVGEVPRRWSVSADPTATRRAGMSCARGERNNEWGSATWESQMITTDEG